MVLLLLLTLILVTVGVWRRVCEDARDAHDDTPPAGQVRDRPAAAQGREPHPVPWCQRRPGGAEQAGRNGSSGGAVGGVAVAVASPGCQAARRVAR